VESVSEIDEVEKHHVHDVAERDTKTIQNKQCLVSFSKPVHVMSVVGLVNLLQTCVEFVMVKKGQARELRKKLIFQQE
jgi:hypothetical protein